MVLKLVKFLSAYFLKTSFFFAPMPISFARESRLAGSVSGAVRMRRSCQSEFLVSYVLTFCVFLATVI